MKTTLRLIALVMVAVPGITLAHAVINEGSAEPGRFTFITD